MRASYLHLSLCCTLVLLLFVCCDTTNNQRADNYAAENNEIKSWDPPQDSSFLFNAYLYSYELVQYNELAAQKAQTPAVKSFAENSAAWHKKINGEIRQMLDQQEKSINKDAAEDLQEKLRELRALASDAFEQAYLQTLSDTQHGIIKQCEKAAEHATEAEVRTWATHTLPRLQAHALAAEELSALIKNNKK